tara:strand:+ start:1631 stop:2248 length:618 start_codon:yes stop_codon:yes gene_type:complete
MIETHHALVYIAPSLSRSTLPDTLRKQTVDVQHIIVDRLGIADARALIAQAQQTAVTASGRSFVLVAGNIPVEAQNALLKLFEEPPKGVQFHLIIPQEGLLIPTLRSRVQLVARTTTADNENDLFQTFLTSSYAERLTCIADITKQKDAASIEAIIHGAEQYAARDVVTNAGIAPSVLLAREYVQTPGASKKMLLEELALALPQG